MFNGKDDLRAEFRRVEVLTGPGRRRRWSAEDKARIVAEAMMPGAVVSEVARRWQLSSQQVFGWRREARAGLLALPADGTVAGLPLPDFVPILSEPAVSVVVPEAACIPTIEVEVEVEIAGAVEGGANWAHVASLVETCKLNGVDPQAYLCELLTRLVGGWPQARIDELMPWHWAARRSG